MGTLTLTPAYGRDYKTQVEVKAAWAAGKDFEVATLGAGGRYINLEDARSHGVRRVMIRYKGLRQVVVIDVK